MIQQFRKINVLTTTVMLITFSASVALVTLTTPTKTSSKKSEHTLGMSVEFNKLDTSTFPCLDPSSPLSFLIYQIPGVFRSQLGSPIRFVGFGIFSSMSSTDVQVTNCSNRAIRVFAVGHRGNVMDEANRTARLVGLWNHALEPGEGGTVSVYWHWKELWIDFVEFSDGSTWGPNEMNSRQTLDASRAGMKEAASQFTKILEENGPDAVVASFPKKVNSPQSQMNDREWNEDFQSAFRGVYYELYWAQEEVFHQFRRGDSRKAALRNKLSAILSMAASANHGSSAADSRPHY